ncbi:hypothetical protein ATO6_09785 [Oceanicola sp. 22II-s10i]|uniref:hypothetical protein n=1 Tax=Oceanicola sp. 22II-s10i TaxID=1317116 RepID=UPI000B51FE04|nr:hypothetical protein [Oceanicola sp. 22II-s10i]OWU85297.1 hypothetical protein ATO6_09785 [Oceanicola sp. 22II-s10i]
MTDLETRAEHVVSAIAGARPGTRHQHLSDLHHVVSEFGLRGNGIPQHLRQLQEELTNEAIEAQFDNLPV